VYLFPQLGIAHTKVLLPEVSRGAVSSLRERSAVDHPDAIYTAVGGIRVSINELKELQAAIRSVAQGSGYPLPQPHGGYRAFDLQCARELADRVRVVPAEAAKPGVWQFLCCALVPDVVRWRFFNPTEPTSEARFLGGVRNMLGRLWWRAYILEGESGFARGEDLLGRLSEEELVQLFERPTLAGCRPLIRSTALAFLEIAERGFPQRQSLIRDAQKRVMRLASVISFDGLQGNELSEVIGWVMQNSASAVQRKEEAV
jgi:hypothetical protein